MNATILLVLIFITWSIEDILEDYNICLRKIYSLWLILGIFGLIDKISNDLAL